MKWILTDTEAVEAFYEAQTGGAGRLNVAKAQARKIVEWLDGECAHTATQYRGHPRKDCPYCMEQLKKEIGL